MINLYFFEELYLFDFRKSCVSLHEIYDKMLKCLFRLVFDNKNKDFIGYIFLSSKHVSVFLENFEPRQDLIFPNCLEKVYFRSKSYSKLWIWNFWLLLLILYDSFTCIVKLVQVLVRDLLLQSLLSVATPSDQKPS